MATKVFSVKDSHAQELQRLTSELERLNSDAEGIRKKLSADSDKLKAAEAERARLVAKIQSGDADSTILRGVADQITTLEIKIGGYDGRLTEIQTRTEQLQLEITERRESYSRAERDERIAELQKSGEARALKIRSALVSITQDIYEFDQIRVELGRELGAVAVAKGLRELLYKPTTAMEALRTPELHLCELEDHGWSARSSAPVHEVPGGNLNLTVLSLQPKPQN